MLNHNDVDVSVAVEFDCYNMDADTAKWYEGLISEHSHDVNGRIMSLKLSLYLLEKQPLTPDMQRIIDRLKAEVEDLTRMVQDLRKESKPCCP